jgi:pimeloyl-ACP methyl ester carboxylesterase
MRRVVRPVLLFIAVLLLIVLIGPFFLPSPTLDNPRSPEELAGEQGRFVEINGIQIHYEIYGQGEPFWVLLHGFGASTFSWREVTGPMAEMGTVLVYDRPAFGLTERPLNWEGNNPYSPQANLELLLGLLDHFDIDKAILVGNSAGGTLAVQAALKYPQRIDALVLVDPAIYTGGGAPPWIRPLLATPQMRRLGPLFVQRVFSSGEQLIEMAWHDPSRITPEILEGYERPLQLANWPQALWEMTLASQEPDLAKNIMEMQQPTLVITGEKDRIVPAEQSIRLAGELPNASLSVIPACGHLPQEECPDEFMEAFHGFMAEILTSPSEKFQ